MSSRLLLLRSARQFRGTDTALRSICFSSPKSRFYSSVPADKPFYITAPIFYVNAAPHIGHLYTLILADVLKRWSTLKGQKAILCTGTDEHGMKIQQAAAKAGVDVRAFCKENSEAFKALEKTGNIDYDHFIRTSEPEHRFAVQHFWLMLRERGHIYESKHEGWYSVSDEAFYPEKQVRLAMDPATGRKFMASIETGKEVEWTSETNYFFRLSNFRDRLLDFYKANPDFVVPSTRMNDVLQAVEAGLNDLSVSRPAERLSWGIPVPDDESQTIYVWLDALINYLTKANYPFQIPGQEHAAGWPADVQIVGKEIVRFHCIYWPAFLMALDIPPPKRVLTHAHWTLGKQKMSKSAGNVVNPFYAVNRFGLDALRYYMVLDGGIRDDSSYENSLVVERYKKGLSGGLGNLASRLLRSKNWSVRRAVQNAAVKPPHSYDGPGKELRERLMALPAIADARMQEPNPSAALAAIMEAVYATNAYMQHAKPWELARTHKVRELLPVVFLCAEALRVIGILLQPFMPQKAALLLDQLGVDKRSRGFSATDLGSDTYYGNPMVNLGRGQEGILFPPLVTED